MKPMSFRDTLRELRRQCPLRYPVRIMRRARIAKNLWGEADRLKRRDGSTAFVIRIAHHDLSTSEGRATERDTLIHEWAHCMAWPEGRQRFHGSRWGRAFASAYRAGTGDHS